MSFQKPAAEVAARTLVVNGTVRSNASEKLKKRDEIRLLFVFIRLFLVCDSEMLARSLAGGSCVR